MCITSFNPSEPCCGEAAPIPSSHSIYRIMRPALIEDYEGLSNTPWQSGITGHPSPAWNTNCVFHHFTVESRREPSPLYVLPPVRWSIAAPEFDGGSYDAWDEDLANQFRHHNLSFTIGTLAIREKLLPRGWHGRFVDDRIQLPLFGVPSLEVCQSNDGSAYLQSALQAIEPGIIPTEYDGGSNDCPVNRKLVAFRHVVDGGPVKRLFFEDDFSDQKNWQCKVKPEQRYSIDCWYSIQHAGGLIYPETPGKGCAFLSLNRVDNGSTRTGARSNLMTFRNVNFSPAYNWEKHTYEITVGGHLGWKLKDGSNGPHKIQTGGGWQGASYSTGVNFNNDDAAGYFGKIQLRFTQECAQIEIFPGDAMRSLGINSPLVYRSHEDATRYRQRTVSADFGEIFVAPNGRFNQAGTTTFHLVPWTLDGGYLFSPTLWFATSDGSNYQSRAIPRQVPRTITITRTGI